MAEQRVLLIEADGGDVERMRELFEGAGYEVVVAGDGRQGVEVARAEHPSLIVLAVELPGLSGYTTCGNIKRDPSLQGIPLIITSSTATPETFAQHRNLRTRADEYLHKPLNLEQLRGVASAYLPMEAEELLFDDVDEQVQEPQPPLEEEVELELGSEGLDQVLDEIDFFADGGGEELNEVEMGELEMGDVDMDSMLDVDAVLDDLDLDSIGEADLEGYELEEEKTPSEVITVDGPAQVAEAQINDETAIAELKEPEEVAVVEEPAPSSARFRFNRPEPEVEPAVEAPASSRFSFNRPEVSSATPTEPAEPVAEAPSSSRFSFNRPEAPSETPAEPVEPGEAGVATPSSRFNFNRSEEPASAPVEPVESAEPPAAAEAPSRFSFNRPETPAAAPAEPVAEAPSSRFSFSRPEEPVAASDEPAPEASSSRFGFHRSEAPEDAAAEPAESRFSFNAPEAVETLEGVEVEEESSELTPAQDDVSTSENLPMETELMRASAQEELLALQAQISAKDNELKELGGELAEVKEVLEAAQARISELESEKSDQEDREGALRDRLRELVAQLELAFGGGVEALKEELG